MEKKSRKSIRPLIATITAAVLALSVFFLGGCTLFTDLFGSHDVEFTRSTLTMYVGDSYDLDDIIDTDASSYTVSVSPTSIASVNGSTLTARKAGTAEVTVKTSGLNYDTLKLTVKAKSEDSLSFSVTGELVQGVGYMSEVVFTPKATGSATAGIDWYVNGELKSSLSASTAFRFTPSAAGEYVIMARSGSLSASETIRVYYPVEASCDYTGELTQESPFTAITFTVTAGENALNPANTIEWFVDGQKRADVTGAVFNYMPTAGTHTVTVKVNGNQIHIADSAYITVICTGAIVPSTPTIEYDNLYPHVYLNHDATGLVCVEITPPGGTASEYRETDSRYADIFETGRVDIGELISLCASGSSRGAYRFRIKSLGDGGALRESEYSEPLVFTQLPSAAARFISELYYDKDFYITSDEEYVNVLEYKVISRTKAANARVSFDVYIAYDMPCTARELWDDAFSIAATSGSYTGISVDLNGNVMSTSFKVDTVNTPTRQSRDTHGASSYSKQLHAMIPHINFDPEKYRDASHVFPIDTLEKTQSVTYTDELYLAAQNNTRPVPTPDSPAQTVYNAARNILRQICTDDMTDAQKAHAIYDWIMWQVTYDTPATEARSSGESYSAYYLEGVFGDGVTSIKGVTYEPYAVCDGMSKAYSLMCNMEGIPCVRIAGVAGSSLDDAGGHAWNKVFVDDAWYTVDCTWGDTTGTVTISGRPDDYELGIHDHLFITDSMTEGNHFEPYMSGDSSIVYAPATASSPYPVYANYVYNGVNINCEVSDNDNASERLSQIATSFARAYTPRSSIYVPGYGDGNYSITYEGIEVYFPSGVSLSDSAVSSAVTRAVHNVLPSAEVRTLAYDNLVIILIDG